MQFIEKADYGRPLRAVHAPESLEAGTRRFSGFHAVFKPSQLLLEGGLAQDSASVGTEKLLYHKIAIHGSFLLAGRTTNDRRFASKLLSDLSVRSRLDRAEIISSLSLQLI